ncbi:MAG: tetratricopeptide repeat protein [Patescibacteria group bacterium]|nr:tetratricopeptide repeat protein [Patescibacteria group bacterium]
MPAAPFFFKKIFSAKLSARRLVLILVVFGFLIYANSFPNQLFWDDQDAILNNAYIKDLENFENFFKENLIAGAGLNSNYWRPLLLITYSLEWRLWRDWAPGYHFTNAVLHISAAVALFFLLLKLFKNKSAAFFCALVFLIHPLQTEAVTYVSGRADPLSAFLVFLGLISYLNKKTRLTLALFILSLMTKEKNALVFPALIVLVNLYLFFKQRSLKNRPAGKPSLKRLTQAVALKKIWPYFLVAAVYALLRKTVLNFSDTFNLYGQPNLYTQSILIRAATFLKILPQYLYLSFLPHNLHMERLADFNKNFFHLLSLLGLIIVAALLTLAFLKRRTKPYLSFAALWFLVTLFPASGILFPVSGLFYEHYLYLPLIGLFLLLIFLIQDIFSQIKLRPFSLITFSLIAAAYLGFFSFQTVNRNRVWRDPVTFYNNIIQYNPQSLRVWNNLGMAYAQDRQYEQALFAYQKAIQLDQQKKSAPPYHNLGRIYEELNQPQAAISSFEQAIQIDQRFIFSYFALASLYTREKNYDKAMEILKKAQNIFPKNSSIPIAIRQVQLKAAKQ